MKTAKDALLRLIADRLGYLVEYDAVAGMTIGALSRDYGVDADSVAACVERELQITLSPDERAGLPRMSLEAAAGILAAREAATAAAS